MDPFRMPGSEPVAEIGSEMELVVHRAGKHVAEEHAVHGMQSRLLEYLKDRFPGDLQ